MLEKFNFGGCLQVSNWFFSYRFHLASTNWLLSLGLGALICYLLGQIRTTIKRKANHYELY